MQREISTNHTGDWDEQHERLSAYLDGELDEGERAALERHLPTCEQCQRALDEVREVRALLHAMPTPALPRSFVIPATGEVPLPLAPAAHDRAESAARRQLARHGNSGWSSVAQALGAFVAAAGVVLVLGSALMGTGPHFGAASPASSGASRSTQIGQHDNTTTAGSTQQATPRAADQNKGTPTPPAGAAPPAHTSTQRTFGAPQYPENPPIVPIGAGMVAGGVVLFVAGRVSGKRRGQA